WNHPDTPMLYCASSIALACLETMVHIAAGSLPLNRYLVRIDVPDDVWDGAQTLTAASAPAGWDALPEGKVSLDYGTQWAMSKSTALLCVPSVVVPEEWNVLVNPKHADAARVTATKLRKWIYDARI
ncbi:MAG TPA: RES family NAD+ phosphorylase, partial [Herbaspirillum sp.]|nr:RES family NAD+ phosphorylase [Herbaspirillum sp.]